MTTTLYNSVQNQIIEARRGSTVTSQNVWNIDYVNDLLLRDDNSTPGNLGISGSGLGQRLYSQHDANFNVTALADTSGNVAERFVYTPYGVWTVLDASWATTSDAYQWRVGFQGMRLLITGSNDTYQSQTRVYFATLGRWGSPDGGYHDGANLYQAFLSNPPLFSDPGGTKAAIAPSVGLVQLAPVVAPVVEGVGGEGLLIGVPLIMLVGLCSKGPHVWNYGNGVPPGMSCIVGSPPHHQYSLVNTFLTSGGKIPGSLWASGSGSGKGQGPCPENASAGQPQGAPPPATATNGSGGQPPVPPVVGSPFADGGPFDSFEDATGMLGGPAENVQYIGPAHDPVMNANGFTEKWIGQDPDTGDWYSAFHNPATDQWAGGDLSSHE